MINWYMYRNSYFQPFFCARLQTLSVSFVFNLIFHDIKADILLSNNCQSETDNNLNLIYIDLTPDFDFLLFESFKCFCKPWLTIDMSKSL